MVEEVSASSSSNNDAACDDHGGGRSGGRGGVVRGHVVHSTSASTFRPREDSTMIMTQLRIRFLNTIVNIVNEAVTMHFLNEARTIEEIDEVRTQHPPPLSQTGSRNPSEKLSRPINETYTSLKANMIKRFILTKSSASSSSSGDDRLGLSYPPQRANKRSEDIEVCHDHHAEYNTFVNCHR
jgi:hypothetical protein